MNYLTTNKLWLRPDEAARELSVSLKTVYRMAGEGLFVCAKIRGSLRIYGPSLESYLHDQVQFFAIETGVVSFVDK
jgi:excisionase family DNA binding protein